MSTTVETPVAPDAPTEDVEDASPARWVGDAAAVLLLGAVLLYLEDHDGGLEIGALRWVGLVAGLALPAVASELRRLPRWLTWSLAAWSIGSLASVAFAEIRAYALAPALVHAIAPVVYLATRRLWRRPWGPTALVGLVTLALAMYWHRSFLQWWGHTLNGQQPIWMALSWRNQSGILMGALGLLALGLSLRTTRVLRVAAGLLAAAAFAGVWLSSSRGAVLIVGLAAAVVVATAARHDLRRTAASAFLVATLAAGATVGLLAMDQRTDAASPLASRTNTVEHNGRARLFHMEAATGMFLDRPLTGQGLGSYVETARPFTDPRANLTSSAHNEYAENLGEGGLLLGGPFLVLSGAAALAALGALRRRPDHDPLRAGLELGGAAVVLAIGAHAGLDFDWGYLVLPALFAIGAAVVTPSRRHDATTPLPAWSAGLALAILLLGATVVASAQIARGVPGGQLTPEEFAAAPWPLDLGAHVNVGYALWRDDHDALARDVAERGLRWNPGATRLATLAAITRFELGDLDAPRLAASLREGWNRFDEYTYVASSLVDAGELTLAAEVLDRQRAELTAHAAWGVTEAARSTWPVVVELEALRGGCVAAHAAAERALEDDLAAFPDTVTPDEVLAAAGVDC